MIIPDNFLFHHLGYATQSIKKELISFLSIGYQIEGEHFTDDVQGVEGCFLVGAGPRIELLQNLPGAQTLTPWLNANIKFYHLAYLVPNMDAALIWARNQRAHITVNPVPAVAFEGRLISFVIMRNGVLIEFIENQK